MTHYCRGIKGYTRSLDYGLRGSGGLGIMDNKVETAVCLFWV